MQVWKIGIDEHYSLGIMQKEVILRLLFVLHFVQIFANLYIFRRKLKLCSNIFRSSIKDKKPPEVNKKNSHIPVSIDIGIIALSC